MPLGDFLARLFITRMGGHLTSDELMKLKSLVYLLMEKCLSPLTDKIVCISEAEKESAEREHIAKKDKLELIPNGIDVSAVKNAIPKQRSELGIPDEAFVVGMIGRLSPQKAPDVFIHAAKLIHDSIPDSAFIMVGDGEEREAVESFARENGLNLYVTGWTDTPYSYLKVFDVALLLSRWEGFGLAIVEYMAAEKNVVASRVDAIPTLIDDGTDGLLAEVDDPEDVRDKVIWLYNHPEEARIMKKKALEKVIKNYDISRVVEQHADLFVKICKHGGGKM